MDKGGDFVQFTKFKNKYRINSTRLKNYDYSSDGLYFITICTDGRKHYFGEIDGTFGVPRVSDAGMSRISGVSRILGLPRVETGLKPVSTDVDLRTNIAPTL